MRNHSFTNGEPPLISVVVALYNGEKFIQGLLEDLEAQTIAEKTEIIIVETGSSTDEITVIKEFQERFDNILYVRTSFRVNVAVACNFGISIASGKYITLGPVDDRRRHNSFQVLSDELEAHPEVGLVYADNFVTNFENQTFSKHVRSGYKIRPEYRPEIMLSGCHMGPQAMWRRELHDEIGYFDEVLESATDYEFWCRIATRYPMRHVSAFLGLYFDNPKGIVNSNAARNHEQTKNVQKLYEGKFPPPAADYSRGMHYLKPMQDPKYVNICMVTFNRLEFTKAAIASILQFTCFPHVLTVVDNGSTDGTVEYLEAMKQEGIITNLILLNENVGVAKASNLAWSQEPEAEFYMKFDNDIVIQKPNWLDRMVEVLDAIPELAMVGYNFEPKSYPLETIHGQQVRPKQGNLGGACVLIPKRTEKQLGFWCEDYGLYGEEDADYGARTNLAGLKHAYMEDEEIGVHLPAGRAASIDPTTSIAEDGIEEHQYSDYRRFKDSQRHANMQGRAKENFELYQLGRKSLYCASEFVATYSKERLTTSALTRSVAPVHVSSVPLDSSKNSEYFNRRVSVIANDSFCGGLRLFYPLQSLLNRKALTGQLLLEADIWQNKVELPTGIGETLVLQRIASLVEAKLEAAKVQGTRIVHDFDDLLWKIPKDNQNSQVITRPMLDCFFRIMAQADCVTVSTEPLRDALARLKIPSTLLPNCLFPEHWEHLSVNRRIGSRPRVGWVGQVGVHKEDVAVLLPVIEMLGKEVEWVFLGEIPEVPTGVPFEAESHSMVPLQDFPKKLASLNLDLALAPLAMNEFNEAKSDLRVLQYGILGYPVVATDIFPYQMAPVTRVSNDPQDWAQAIRDHINNRDSSEAKGEGLRQWILSHRMFEQWASHYQTAWLGERLKEKEAPKTESSMPVSFLGPNSLPQGGEMTFDCSIIIPVFNKFELTKQCLTQLAEVTHRVSYEVIVVDNASKDETGDFLSSLEGDVQIISNDSNRGFAKACNQGAKAAKGKYLVFLNNDTIPQDGWLSALVEEKEQHPDIGIVGSKLLYPNRTIQHAGVVFSKKCLTPYHIFNGAPSDFPPANIRQEFQAVTAACFLIQREDFDSVGGFDEQFLNGFEDVDLCLKIKESGKKVIYQPKSWLYHLEEQTPGRKDPDAERRNGRLLMDRWAEKIIVDEDYYTVSSGYASRYSSSKGSLGLTLEKFPNQLEKSQWEQVKRVQEFLLKKQYAQGQPSNEQIDSAIRLVLTDISSWPDDIDTLKWAATVCEGFECVESACSFMKRVLTLGEDRDARVLLAKQDLKDGDLIEASQHVRALLGLNPNDGKGLWLQGVLAMQSLEYSRAKESFRRALDHGSDRQKGGLGLGMACMGLGEAGNAWEAFRLVLEAFPDSKEAMNGLLQSGTVLECWEPLIGYLTYFLDRNPASCDMRFALAGVCFRAGKIEESRKHFEILQMVSPEFEGLAELEKQLRKVQEAARDSSTNNRPESQIYKPGTLQSYFQSSTGNTETYIRILPAVIVDHSLSVRQVLRNYTISGFGAGIEAVEKILPIVFERQFAQGLGRPCDMWDRVVAITVDCQLVHGPTGISFCSLRPRTLEDIDETFAQQEGPDRKEEILAHLKKLKDGENLGRPLYISGTILRYLGAPAENEAMYMLDGARRMSASALHHQERITVTLLVFEEEFSKFLQESVKKGIQGQIHHLAWFQNYHSFPFLGIEGQRSLQRFNLMETERLKNSVILDFGCNLGQASLKAIQYGAKEVWGIEGMQDTIAIANEIKRIAGCDNLHYLQADFNDPQFDRIIDQAISGPCDYSFFFSVYRTKELTQRDRLFQYILNKTKKGVFFEGHAHPQIDTLEFYDWLFDSFNVPYTFLGYSEGDCRPLYFLDLEKQRAFSEKILPSSIPEFSSR